MSKWDKHSRKWEPSFKQRLGQQAEAKQPKPEKKTYIVSPPRSRYDDWGNSLSAVHWRIFMDEHYYSFARYKDLTYEEMIELKLRGYTIETA